MAKAKPLNGLAFGHGLLDMRSGNSRGREKAMTLSELKAYVDGYADKLREAGCTEVTVVYFCAPLDNYEPCPRSEANGYVVRYVKANGESGITLWRTDFGKVGSRIFDALHSAVFLVDDGRTVTPYYVAGYRPTDEPDALFLQPFPTNFNADGSPRMRGDRAEQVDMSGWALGPRKAYHVKLSV